MIETNKVKTFLDRLTEIKYNEIKTVRKLISM